VQILIFALRQRRLTLPRYSIRFTRKVFAVTVLLFAAFFCGCAGTVSSSNTSGGFSISGTISPAANGSGTTLTLSGSTAASTTASSSGSYSFSGLSSGTYAVTPERTGYIFEPVVQSAVIGGTSVSGINFTASALSSHTVLLRWQSSTSTVSGYNIYRGISSGGPYEKLNTSPVAADSYTDSSLAVSTTYYYVTTAVNASGVESTYSNQAVVNIP